jgi:tetratricopeptide (TPR) repeat protein
MPQVFSAGWLYLLIIVIVISLIRIWLKVRTIQAESPMDRPVIKLAPLPGVGEGTSDTSRDDPILSEPDNLIRQGELTAALVRLQQTLGDLSPTEDREIRGKVLFRIGACHVRLARGEERLQHLLRAGEALRESVRLFAPGRYRNYYLNALEELAGLYEDLAAEKSPVENLTQAARTCETAADSASEGGLPVSRAGFLVRSGNVYRQLAGHGEPRNNLQKAVTAFERALEALQKAEERETPSERMSILAHLGDVYADLSEYVQKEESLDSALKAYGGALDLMEAGPASTELQDIHTKMGRILLRLYDSGKNPVHLRQALRHTRDAFEALKGQEHSVSKGKTMAVMGDALYRFADVKDRRENLERAVKLYEASLGVLKDGVEPEERERVRERLAETVRKLSPESG